MEIIKIIPAVRELGYRGNRAAAPGN